MTEQVSAVIRGAKLSCSSVLSFSKREPSPVPLFFQKIVVTCLRSLTGLTRSLPLQLFKEQFGFCNLKFALISFPEEKRRNSTYEDSFFLPERRGFFSETQNECGLESKSFAVASAAYSCLARNLVSSASSCAWFEGCSIRSPA